MQSIYKYLNYLRIILSRFALCAKSRLFHHNTPSQLSFFCTAVAIVLPLGPRLNEKPIDRGCHIKLLHVQQRPALANNAQPNS